MKKLFVSMLMGICIMFFATTTFAQTDEVFAKQAEVDKYVFEEKASEIAEKGITVTHTVSLEDKVEIGITPFTEENANYFYDAFGKEDVIVVEGQQASTLQVGVANTTSTVVDNTMVEQETASTSGTVYYVGAGIILIAAGVFFVFRKRSTVKG